MFHTILGYFWQYITNPKAIIALSFLVALISSYNLIPRHIFWALIAAYALAACLVKARFHGYGYSLKR